MVTGIDSSWWVTAGGKHAGTEAAGAAATFLFAAAGAAAVAVAAFLSFVMKAGG